MRYLFRTRLSLIPAVGLVLAVAMGPAVATPYDTPAADNTYPSGASIDTSFAAAATTVDESQTDDPIVPLDAYGTATDIANASSALNAVPAIATVSPGGVITVTLTSSGTNAVDLSLPDGATITGISLVTANGATPTGVVLNLSGDNLKFIGGAYTTGTPDNAVLYNFINATTLTFNSTVFEGTVIAPFAVVSYIGGRIDGLLIAANLLDSVPLDDTGVSMSLPAYTLVVPSVSEPSSLAIFLTALLALGFHRQRKR